MKIDTRDANGQPNGFVVPIWNALESDYRPDQVYLTAVLPSCAKGPHLHYRRAGLFCCIKGNAVIVVRFKNGVYTEIRTGEDYGYQKVFVPTGCPAAIYNLGSETALIVNMPTPAWSKDEPDEWPVEDWNYCPHKWVEVTAMADKARQFRCFKCQTVKTEPFNDVLHD